MRILILCLLVSACVPMQSKTTKPAWPEPTYYLPHRPPTGNHGQGQAPPVDCPRQYREIIKLDDSQSVLLYCWGKAVTT